MAGFFVFFVVDEVDDDLAGQVRRRVRAIAGARGWREQPPGFVDDPSPEAGSSRTTGG